MSSARMRSKTSGVFASSVATGRLVQEPSAASASAHSSTRDPPRSDRCTSRISRSRATYRRQPPVCLPLFGRRPATGSARWQVSKWPALSRAVQFPAPHTQPPGLIPPNRLCSRSPSVLCLQSLLLGRKLPPNCGKSCITPFLSKMWQRGAAGCEVAPRRTRTPLCRLRRFCVVLAGVGRRRDRGAHGRYGMTCGQGAAAGGS